MKKITLASLLLLTIFIGCKKNTSTDLQVTDKGTEIIQRSCAANEVFLRQLAEDPT